MRNEQTPRKKTQSGEQSRLRYMDKQAGRVHGEKLFSMCVLAAVIAAGLCFMAAGISGGRELVIGGTSYFAGYRVGGKLGLGGGK